MPGTNHDWLDLDHYLAIHERCMAQAETYFVFDHDIHRPVVISSTQVRFTGVIHCYDDIEIHVDKVLDRDTINRVRGRYYRYHAQRTNPVIPILRYDTSPHFHEFPDRFHKHDFDANGQETRVVHIGRQHWPTLLDVINEVYDWWCKHLAE